MDERLLARFPCAVRKIGTEKGASKGTLGEPRLFDSNCLLGRHARLGPASLTSVSSLREAMAHYGIAEALVHHALARDHHPLVGNQRLLEEIANCPELHPCWVLLPSRGGEMPPDRDMVSDMVEKGVRAARLFPKSYLLVVREWLLGSLLSALEGQKIPLFLDFGTTFPFSDETDWDATNDLCLRHPDLPVVLTHFGFRTNRIIYALLEKHRNLHLELSGMWLYRAIEHLCRNFGAERLLFGTNLPFQDPACTIMPLIYAEITGRERALIGGDNLRRLLETVQAPR